MSAGIELSVSSPLPTHEPKSPTAFRTISEVADDLRLPQHVLRFWESKFKEIKPLKRGGGRRYYRPEDIKVIHDIKDLLYNQGFTIRGVQQLLGKSGASSLARSMVAEPHIPDTLAPISQPTITRSTLSHTTPTTGLSTDKRREMEGVLAELRSIRKILEQSGI